MKKKLTQFPDVNDINTLFEYLIPPEDKSPGWFNPAQWNKTPQHELKDSDEVHRRYLKLISIFDCCAKLIKHDFQSKPHYIARFFGDNNNESLVLFIYDNYYAISVNPDPKIMFRTNHFELSKDDSNELFSLLNNTIK